MKSSHAALALLACVALPPAVKARWVLRDPMLAETGPGQQAPSFLQQAKQRNGGRNLRQQDSAEKAPVAPITVPDDKTPIHISVSAFQDGERCAKTLNWAFAKAQNRDRLSIGVVQARGEHDLDCVDHFHKEYLPQLCQSAPDQSSCEKSFSDRVRKKVITLAEAEGPNHQRSFSHELVDYGQSDKMCMQIDSHMGFLQNWDQLLMDDWIATHNEFAVLTHYPMAIDTPPDRAIETYLDCCSWTLENTIPRGHVCYDSERHHGMKPLMTTNWAAGLSFARCHSEQNVPIDPNLEYIFTGEEVSRATRLWTHGYDLYLPTRSVVLHNYTAATQAFHQADSYDVIAPKLMNSEKKLQSLLEMTGEAVGPVYQLGTQRSLQQWSDWGKPFEDITCTQRNYQRPPVADGKALEASAIHPTWRWQIDAEARRAGDRGDVKV
eukprot:gnl/TRDRNA2_/TRDRNA2_138767_c0_seq3.p1 gnl/TRDRNA2_/TRDRNA2_138767_c0~~gnl/TRDRNA2_/TRDRNA2_138767_c0_seq3.p1  ORF type:complete len:436 (+),score=63.19 gnl/TRDRNA2_/TRDRNA2_138767_c0_seq3:58-1365(+)